MTEGIPHPRPWEGLRDGVSRETEELRVSRIPDFRRGCGTEWRKDTERTRGFHNPELGRGCGTTNGYRLR